VAKVGLIFFLIIRAKALVLRASSMWCHSEGVPPLETFCLEVFIHTVTQFSYELHCSVLLKV